LGLPGVVTYKIAAHATELAKGHPAAQSDHRNGEPDAC